MRNLLKFFLLIVLCSSVQAQIAPYRKNVFTTNLFDTNLVSGAIPYFDLANRKFVGTTQAYNNGLLYEPTLGFLSIFRSNYTGNLLLNLNDGSGVAPPSIQAFSDRFVVANTNLSLDAPSPYTIKLRIDGGNILEAKASGISLNNFTNIVADNGTNLTYNGVPIGSDASGITTGLLPFGRLALTNGVAGQYLGNDGTNRVWSYVPGSQGIEAMFNTTGTNSIFLPTNGKWVEIVFRHVTAATNFQDVWYMDRAFFVNRIAPYTYTRTDSFVTNGSWICAIQPTGDASFAGGLHGSEITTNIFVQFDGGVFNLTNSIVTNITTRRLTILQSSMISHWGNTNKMAEHSWVLDFTSNKLKTTQWLLWASNTVLDHAYMNMWPVVRNMGASQITDRAIGSPFYEILDVSTNNFPLFQHQQGNDFTIWGLTSGFSGRLEITKWPGSDPSKRLAFILNNSTDYNKIYFDVAGSGLVVAQGDIWDSAAEYTINRQ